MSNISWIIMVIIEIFLYINLAKAIYGEDIKITKNKTIVFVPIVILLFIMDYYLKINISFISLALGVFIYSNTSFKKKIVNSLVVQIIAMGVQEIVILSTDMYSLNLDAYEIHVQLSDSIYVMVMLILIWLIKYLKENIHLTWDDIPNYLYINVFLGFSAGIFPINLVAVFKKVIPYRFKVLIMIVSYLAIALNLFSIYLFIRNYQEKNKYGRESKEKSELMKVQAQYLENTVKNYEYLKGFRHDMKGHLRILETMCEGNREALDYIEKMGERINSTDVFRCGNQLVSALLNAFGNELNDEGIDHEMHYYVYSEILMDDLELCSLLYNLTNNALEAERKVDKEYRKIEVEISNVRNQLLISISNDVSDDFDMDNINKKRTTKKDKENHGIGLKNVQDILDKHYGYMDCSCKDGRLKIRLMLQDVVRINF